MKSLINQLNKYAKVETFWIDRRRGYCTTQYIDDAQSRDCLWAGTWAGAKANHAAAITQIQQDFAALQAEEGKTAESEMRAERENERRLYGPW